MFIVWKGFGILSLILPVGIGLLCHWIFKSETAGNIGMIIGGALVLLIGLGSLAPNEKEKEQGKKIVLFKDTFFFLPMFLWGIIAIVIAIYRMK